MYETQNCRVLLDGGLIYESLVSHDHAKPGHAVGSRDHVAQSTESGNDSGNLLGVHSKLLSKGPLEQDEVAAVSLQDAGLAHAGELGGKRAAVDPEVIGQLLAIEGDVELARPYTFGLVGKV